MRKQKIILSIIAGCIIIAAGIAGLLANRGRDNTAITRQCDTAIQTLLERNGINSRMLQGTKRRALRSGTTRMEYIEREFRVPPAINLSGLQKAITESKTTAPMGIGKIQKSRDKQEQILSIEFCLRQLTLYRLTLRQKILAEKKPGEAEKPGKEKTGKIALVLDDWGYNRDLPAAALALGIPITYAILPKLPYSQEIAVSLRNAGQEYILHLPLEPHNAAGQSLEKNTILTAMSEEETLDIMRNDMRSLPGISGINNHMGSLATEDERLMRRLMTELKRDNLYFLDSYTSNASVAETTARESGVPFLRRDVFLDNSETRESIGSQMDKTKNIAREKGQVIVIGHARPLTLETLRDLIPKLKNEGFTFVFLSDLKNSE
ncbi:MAG: divergent polysaccharide deacetylase family protein [Candidatus Omnitrophica bacterium]|nr:divergent polysaccharide deacetylase family protein [Candidatus Omnitrophota bacterium]